uniref:Reverse transcriptase Ty1/copia-type domain-containing protein n=1 Tax=Peronospora matthiolae TaxID=2874970 RepID=A0AAV1VMW6_9STRA
MKEQVFCVIPEGVELEDSFDCLELVKAFYGLKQASRVWNETFDEFVCAIGFQASSLDPCLYIRIVGGQCVLLLVYVDDVLITGSSCELIAHTKEDLKTRFEMTDSGKCAFVLGIELLDGADGSVRLRQRRDAATKVNVPFREAVGALMHLTTATRTNAAFAVGYVSRFMGNPQKEHWVAIMRILRYLQDTKTHGICYKPNSKKQPSVSLSTSDAEYIALSLAIQEGKWIHRLLCDIMMAANEEGPELMIHEYNQSCIKMTKNPVNHCRAKHIDIKYHHIRDEVKRGEVKLKYCETAVLLAGIMTKGLHGPRHKEMMAAFAICACSH